MVDYVLDRDSLIFSVQKEQRVLCSVCCLNGRYINTKGPHISQKIFLLLNS